MPIFDQSYRAYDGQLRRRFRWWVMVVQELRVLLSTRTFAILLILATFHIVFRLFQIVVFDMLAANPNNPIAMAMRNVAMMNVDARTFFDFLRVQAPLVFLISLFAGSGLISHDVRNNLLEIYFSKPLSWRDYVLGKTMTLIVVGLAITAVPGIALVVLHNLLAPSFETLQSTYWLPWAILLFSLTIVLPCGLGILASSALFTSERFAGISVFMILLANIAIFTMLPELLQKPDYVILVFPAAINRVGEHLFHVRKVAFDLPWGWSALYVAIVCAVSLVIICRVARRAEVAK